MIPDIEIIDLDNEEIDSPDSPEAYAEPGDGKPPKKRERFNAHIVMLGAMAVILLLIVIRIVNWGDFISQDDIFRDGEGTYVDTLDNFIPLMDEDGNVVPIDYSDGLTIVAFGNAPFADDRDAKNNLVSLIAEKTDATVYNCSVSGSFMAADQSDSYNSKKAPMDAYTFYWLACLACGYDIASYYEYAAEALGSETPPEWEEVVETLTTLDFNTVDVITVMYDATDYLMAHSISDDTNVKNIATFTGNLVAGIEMFQQTYPHIRIIVMSPPYAYAIDDDGEYMSSDIKRYGGEVLSSFCLLQSAICDIVQVTFVDNIYGTITEDNADRYLADNLHLNVNGRKLAAQRFAEALFYFGGWE